MNPLSTIIKKFDNHKRNAAKDQQDKFIDAFSEVLSNGDVFGFEDYLDPFASIITQVWSLRNENHSYYTLETLENNCEKLVDSCASSDDSRSKVLCLRLLAFIYKTIYEQICEEGIRPRGIKNIRYFEVVNYSNVFRFFNHILMKVPTSAIAEQFNLYELLYHMLITDLCLAVEHQKCEIDGSFEETSFVWGPKSTILDILRFIGYYVLEQGKNGSVDNIALSYWKNQIHLWLDHNFQQDTSNEYEFIHAKFRKYLLSAITSASSMLVCGLIDNGQFDIVGEGLYSESMYTEDLPDRVEIKRRVIVISRAFLYYMAYRESDVFVDKLLRESARKFLSDTSGKYLDFINQHDVSDILIDELKTDFISDKDGNRIHANKEYHIKELLKSFDYRMRKNGFGVLILEPVVRDFCLFSILYNNKKCIGKLGFPTNYYGIDGLDWMTDEWHRIEDFIGYVKESTTNFVYSSESTDFESLTERIQQYMVFLDSHSVKRERDGIGNVLLESLVNGIKDRYKKEKEQEVFNSDLQYRQLQANNIRIQYPKIPEWEDTIIQGITEKFRREESQNSFIEPISNIVENVAYGRNAKKIEGVRCQKNLVLYSLCNLTRTIEHSVDSTMVNRICGVLMDTYISMMVDLDMLEKISKTTDSYDDHEYIKILTERQYDMMIGSEYLIRNKDYSLSESFNEATKKFSKITANPCFYGAVLNSRGVIFYLSNPHISVRDADIGDVYSVEELDDGTYEYEQIGGVKLHFTKEELTSFLSRERKVIEVVADVGIKRVGAGEKIGIYIENERMPIV
ncbi:MAG: hypothetical protein IJ232_10035 [Lachnospiraceae bacterium]|nr:hypothetical protein [Lachnospiraceae bacterium]